MMGTLYRGSSVPNAIYRGATAVDSVYRGTDKVWPLPTLDDLIMSHGPAGFWTLDDSVAPMAGEGLTGSNTPYGYNLAVNAGSPLYQYSIGSSGLTGIRDSVGLIHLRATPQPWWAPASDAPQCTFVNFFDGDPGAGVQIGFGDFGTGFNVIENTRDQVRFDTQSDGLISVFPPAGTDYSGLWMRAIRVENAGTATVFDNAVAGTPVALTGNWGKRQMYQHIRGNHLCTMTRVAHFPSLLTDQDLLDLWTQYQIEGA